MNLKKINRLVNILVYAKINYINTDTILKKGKNEYAKKNSIRKNP